MKRLLFICSQNRLRSPTAEQVFATWPNAETDSAGLKPDANVHLSTEQIAWATHIVVMEKAHQRKLTRDYASHLKGKRIICLDIPDEYDYMQPELIRLLEAKMRNYI